MNRLDLVKRIENEIEITKDKIRKTKDRADNTIGYKYSYMDEMMYNSGLIKKLPILVRFRDFLNLFSVNPNAHLCDNNILVTNIDRGNLSRALLEKLITVSPGYKGITIYTIPDGDITEPVTYDKTHLMPHIISENLMSFYIIFQYDLKLSSELLSDIYGFGTTLRPSIERHLGTLKLFENSLFFHRPTGMMELPLYNGEYHRPVIKGSGFTRDKLVEFNSMNTAVKSSPNFTKRQLVRPDVTKYIDEMNDSERRELFYYLRSQYGHEMFYNGIEKDEVDEDE